METKLTFNEILEGLENLYANVSAFARENYLDTMVPEDFQPELNVIEDWSKRSERIENYRKFLFGEIVMVDRYGGEGGGDTWYVVHHFVDHDVYIITEGFYQSYNGVEFYDGWGCCREVRPKEKTITVYE
jgi:hypothetical protein